MKHDISYEENTVYDHLFRPSCSCGWHKGGFCGKDLAVMYAHAHLQDESSHKHSLEPDNDPPREGMIVNES
jgi:hypothetical protein